MELLGRRLGTIQKEKVAQSKARTADVGSG